MLFVCAVYHLLLAMGLDMTVGLVTVDDFATARHRSIRLPHTHTRTQTRTQNEQHYVRDVFVQVVHWVASFEVMARLRFPMAIRLRAKKVNQRVSRPVSNNSEKTTQSNAKDKFKPGR